MSEATEPKVIEVSVNYNGSGKVAMEDYGGESYGYGASASRKYVVPPDWSEQDVADFELQKILEIKDNLEPFLQEERDALVSQSNAKCHAGR
jgi:hypothetical protein